jgi:hypothetical protein
MEENYFFTLRIGVKVNLFFAVAIVDSDARQMQRKNSAITFYSQFAILVEQFDF